MSHHSAKGFTDYLLYIGLITKDTLTNFNYNYNDIANFKNKKITKNTVYSLLSNSLFNYISDLTRENLKHISDNIVNRYIESKNKILYSTLKNIISKKEQKEKILYFKKWRKIKNYISDPVNYRNTKYKFLNYLSNNTIENNYPDNIIGRQKKFLEKSQNKRMNQMIENEKLNNMLCPFTPTIYTKKYKSKNNSNYKSPYLRLYEDVKKKNNNNNNNRNLKSAERRNEQRNVDKRINKLYNDYKVYENKKKELLKEIDNERGLSFKPNMQKTYNGTMY